MTLSALFAVAFSQFRLVNDLRAIQAGDPHIREPLPANQKAMIDDRVKDVLTEQARINRQMLQVLQRMKPDSFSTDVPEKETHPKETQPTIQSQTSVQEITSEDPSDTVSIFDGYSDGDLVTMKRDLLRERLERFEASLTDIDREELDRRLQLQIDQLALQIADQPLPEEVAVLEALTAGGKRLSPAEREWRDQTMQSLRQGALMEMYSEHSLFQELQAVDLMQLQVGEF